MVSQQEGDSHGVPGIHDGVVRERMRDAGVGIASDVHLVCNEVRRLLNVAVLLPSMPYRQVPVFALKGRALRTGQGYLMATLSDRMRELARQVRGIEDQVGQLNRRAAYRYGIDNHLVPFARSSLKQAAEEMKSISEEWNDDSI